MQYLEFASLKLKPRNSKQLFHTCKVLFKKTETIRRLKINKFYKNGLFVKTFQPIFWEFRPK